MEKTASLREILAKNLREQRRKCGFSQEKLAEKAGISTQYLAMMEIARKFPTSHVLEHLAAAMNIHVYELFLVDQSPREELNLLRQDILREMKQTFSGIVEQALQYVSNLNEAMPGSEKPLYDQIPQAEYHGLAAGRPKKGA